MTSGVPFLLLVNSDLNLIAGHSAWHEDNFAIHMPNTSGTVGQTIDGYNMSARRRHRGKALGFRMEEKGKGKS
jgi:hypothetical protein